MPIGLVTALAFVKSSIDRNKDLKFRLSHLAVLMIALIYTFYLHGVNFKHIVLTITVKLIPALQIYAQIWKLSAIICNLTILYSKYSVKALVSSIKTKNVKI